MEYKEYQVLWAINLSAISPEEAVMLARTMFPYPGNETLATSFAVKDDSEESISIDLEEIPRYNKEKREPWLPTEHW